MAKSIKAHGHGLLNFFDITEDGLYSVQSKLSGDEILSKSSGLEVGHVLPLIKGWVNSRSFKATCPWPEESDGPHSPEMCYCKEIFECPNGDYILVLWKNDPSDSEGYRGLILDDSGAPSTYLNNSSTSTGDNVVWGHPCYYWVIPDRKLVISIKFSDSKCDNGLFKKWVKSVVRTRLMVPGYNSRSVTDNAVRIRFSTPSAPEDYSLLYRFETSIREFDTSVEYLERIAESTKEITVRDYVTTFSPDGASDGGSGLFEAANLGVLETITKIIEMFRKSGGSDDSLGKRKVELMIEGKPSIEIVQELLKHNEAADEDDDWSDVIFKTEDDNNVSFKSHRLVERLVMSRSGDPYTGEELYSALEDQRAKYLERFNSADETGDSLKAS
ncbi:hypothetical protein [Pseudomonas sp. PDM19]|uniref:hypothetical protein n=1 Tax=Pseudomonas sp. PDM19 TaxID=2769272 RepID=UPI00177F4768|nr:hypothetical protein [Pseudomonas sp. PDM19]MBD9632884.1 hypothetical protein [Pseudomonas sp. PDM19]